MRMNPHRISTRNYVHAVLDDDESLFLINNAADSVHNFRVDLSST